MIILILVYIYIMFKIYTNYYININKIDKIMFIFYSMYKINNLL